MKIVSKVSAVILAAATFMVGTVTAAEYSNATTKYLVAQLPDCCCPTAPEVKPGSCPKDLFMPPDCCPVPCPKYCPSEPKNYWGQDVWRCPQKDQLMKELAQERNLETFTHRLSKLGCHQWTLLTREQRLRAMELADQTMMSPDAAVFAVSPNM